MYILQVAPLLRLPSTLTHSLTYYHTDHIPRGGVVRISVRNTSHLGVVLSSQSVQEAKMYLRKDSTFSLKQIEEVFFSEPLLSEHQLHVAEWMSTYYAFSLGMLLKSFLPRIHSGLKRLPPQLQKPELTPGPSQNRPSFEMGILSETDAHRPSRLLDLLKSITSHEGQILLLIPSLPALEYYQTHLTECFSNTTLSVITSSLSTRAFRTEWTAIRTGDRSLILGTRAALFLPFHNLHTVIIEDESSGSYYSFDMYPRYHTVDIAYRLALSHGSRLLFSTFLPSLKVNHLLETHGICAPDYPKLPAQTETLNLANERIHGGIPFVSAKGLQAVSANVPTLILSNRRGHSPFIVCQSCGFRFTCPHCDSLLVEHAFHVAGTDITRIFVCHKCTRKFKPKDTCPECQSTDLTFAGAGTERVASMIQEKFPEFTVGILDTDYTPEFETQKDLFERWQHSDVHILVATQMVTKFFALPLSNPPLTIIREGDLSFRFPQFTAKEDTLQTFTRLITQSRYTYIQSWDPNPPEEQTSSPLPALQAGNIATLYETEREERQTFGYPPFGELIAIHSLHRKRAKAWDQARRTKSVLSDISLTPLGPIESVRRRGQFQVSLLLLVNPTDAEGIKRRLLGILERGQQIDINPEDVL